MAKVALVRCESYVNVGKCIERLLNIYGDFSVEEGEKVLLKPNLLMGSSPSKHITTHPYIVKYLSRILKEMGAKVIIGDSPAGRFTQSRLRRIYEETGMRNVAEEIGVELNYDLGSRTVNINGRVLNSVPIANFALNTDKIITLPKMKTHSLTTFTGAIKITYGCVPGIKKAYYHGKFPRAGEFSKVLLDVYFVVNPSYTLMDGIYGMEGSGPSAGTPRKIGILMFSEDSVAVDVVACKILGIPLHKVPYLAILKSEGKIPNVEIIGDDPPYLKDFKYPKFVNTGRMANSFLLSLLLKIEKKPYPVHEKCVGCGECASNCPRKAIDIIHGKAVINYEKCIKCLICQESCPYHAIEMRRIFRKRR